MTWLAILLKPLIGPLIEFIGRLLARWGAIIFWRVLPDGKLRRVLFDKTLLDRYWWIPLLVYVAGYTAIVLYVVISSR